MPCIPDTLCRCLRSHLKTCIRKAVVVVSNMKSIVHHQIIGQNSTYTSPVQSECSEDSVLSCWDFGCEISYSQFSFHLAGWWSKYLEVLCFLQGWWGVRLPRSWLIGLILVRAWIEWLVVSIGRLEPFPTKNKLPILISLFNTKSIQREGFTIHKPMDITLS